MNWERWGVQPEREEDDPERAGKGDTCERNVKKKKVANEEI